MTATATPARFLRVRQPSLVTDDLTIFGCLLFARGKHKGYYVSHLPGSCEVTWEHEHDASRKYTVTCSPTDASPYRCTCPARKPCKHRAATAALIENSYLDLPTLTDAGHDRSATE